MGITSLKQYSLNLLLFLPTSKGTFEHLCRFKSEIPVHLPRLPFIFYMVTSVLCSIQ